MKKAIFRLHSYFCLLSLVFAVSTKAQNIPVHVILPVGPGSTVDIMVRTAAAALSRELNGQTVVIENMPGAGGITGTAALVKAEPNGNTIAFVSNNHVVNPSVYKQMPFDSLNDITPIAVVGYSPFVLVVNPKAIPAKTAKELQIFLKERPDEFNYGSSGNGTILHLASEMFVQAAEVKVRHIPYKGVGPMVTDIMSGQVQLGVVALASVQAQIKNGNLRAIGIVGNKRVASMPDLPTIAEQGFPTVDMQGWFAVIGPAKLPLAQINRLHDAVSRAFNDPSVKDKLSEQDNFVDVTSPSVAAQYFKSEFETYAKLIQKSGLQID